MPTTPNPRIRYLVVLVTAALGCRGVLGIERGREASEDATSTDGSTTGDAGGGVVATPETDALAPGTDAGSFSCTGAFLCDDFERSSIPGGPLSWGEKRVGDGELAITTDPTKGGGLRAKVGQSGAAALEIERAMPFGGKALVTVSLGYEMLDRQCSAGGYTDLVLVVIPNVGWMNVTLGADCDLALNYRCSSGPTCEWIPLVSGGIGPGRHDLVYGARFTGQSAEAYYELDGKRVTQPLALPLLPASPPNMYLAVGVDHGGSRTGTVTVRYDQIAVRVDPL